MKTQVIIVYVGVLVCISLFVIPWALDTIRTPEDRTLGEWISDLNLRFPKIQLKIDQQLYNTLILLALAWIMVQLSLISYKQKT